MNGDACDARAASGCLEAGRAPRWMRGGALASSSHRGRRVDHHGVLVLVSLDEHTVKELQSIEAKSKSKVDIAHVSTARAKFHLPRVGRDCSRPEQSHRSLLEVGTPGHVCRRPAFFHRLSTDRFGCQAAGTHRTSQWHSRLPQSMQTAPPHAGVGGVCGAALMRAVGAPVAVCVSVVQEPAHRACRHLGLRLSHAFRRRKS